jgi:chromosome segregation ATPase
MKFGILLKIILSGGLMLLCSLAVFSQATGKPDPSKAQASVANPVKSSQAFAEVLLRRTELQAEMESLLVEYTEEYPKIKEARFELAAIQKEIDRLLAVKPADISKLTQALGKLMVRKLELETDLWVLRAKYDDAHPDVKRAKKKLEIYEASIKEILG